MLFDLADDVGFGGYFGGRDEGAGVVFAYLLQQGEFGLFLLLDSLLDVVFAIAGNRFRVFRSVL